MTPYRFPAPSPRLLCLPVRPTVTCHEQLRDELVIEQYNDKSFAHTTNKNVSRWSYHIFALILYRLSFRLFKGLYPIIVRFIKMRRKHVGQFFVRRCHAPPRSDKRHAQHPEISRHLVTLRAINCTAQSIRETAPSRRKKKKPMLP